MCIYRKGILTKHYTGSPSDLLDKVGAVFISEKKQYLGFQRKVPDGTMDQHLARRLLVL